MTRPGLEPGISGSGGRRLIHWANGPFLKQKISKVYGPNGQRTQNEQFPKGFHLELWCVTPNCFLGELDNNHIQLLHAGILEAIR